MKLPVHIINLQLEVQKPVVNTQNTSQIVNNTGKIKS